MIGPGPGQVLFRFVRHWSRRQVTGDSVAEQGRLVLVAEAVNSLHERDNAATVNAIADEIGIDQSGASRLVRSATAAGYLGVTVSSSDSRRREASLTAAGRSMLDQAHRWQEEVFDQLTDGWTEQDRRRFEQAMTALLNRSYILDE